MLKFLHVIGCMAVLMGPSCIDLSDENILPVGTPFVLQGTATVISTDGGPCAVWIGENGVTYHLFQDPLLDNDLFDQVTTSGTTSRLVIATRRDLEVSCQLETEGTIVEVDEILEVLGGSSP